MFSEGSVYYIIYVSYHVKMQKEIVVLSFCFWYILCSVAPTGRKLHYTVQGLISLDISDQGGKERYFRDIVLAVSFLSHI